MVLRVIVYRVGSRREGGMEKRKGGMNKIEIRVNLVWTDMHGPKFRCRAWLWLSPPKSNLI